MQNNNAPKKGSSNAPGWFIFLSVLALGMNAVVLGAGGDLLNQILDEYETAAGASVFTTGGVLTLTNFMNLPTVFLAGLGFFFALVLIAVSVFNFSHYLNWNYTSYMTAVFANIGGLALSGFPFFFACQAFWEGDPTVSGSTNDLDNRASAVAVAAFIAGVLHLLLALIAYFGTAEFKATPQDQNCNNDNGSAWVCKYLLWISVVSAVVAFIRLMISAYVLDNYLSEADELISGVSATTPFLDAFNPAAKIFALLTTPISAIFTLAAALCTIVVTKKESWNSAWRQPLTLVTLVAAAMQVADFGMSCKMWRQGDNGASSDDADLDNRAAVGAGFSLVNTIIVLAFGFAFAFVKRDQGMGPVIPQPGAPVKNWFTHRKFWGVFALLNFLLSGFRIVHLGQGYYEQFRAYEDQIHNSDNNNFFTAWRKGENSGSELLLLWDSILVPLAFGYAVFLMIHFFVWDRVTKNATALLTWTHFIVATLSFGLAMKFFWEGDPTFSGTRGDLSRIATNRGLGSSLAMVLALIGAVALKYTQNGLFSARSKLAPAVKDL